MIFQYDRFLVAECFSEALALTHRHNHARIVIKQRQIRVKRAGILGQRVKQSSKRRPGFTVDRVGVSGRCHLGAGHMDMTMNGKRRPV